MINYVNLPNEMKNFIKEFNYVNLTKDMINHNWKYIPFDTVITTEGKQWFREKKIPVEKYVLLFKIPKNFEGPIHTDMLPLKKSNCAFNFVLSGNGKMQWITNLEATEYIENVNSSVYRRYTNIKQFDILDTWTGDVGLVRINVPHRVVTTNADRYCISIRLVNDISPNTFDEIKEVLGV